MEKMANIEGVERALKARLAEQEEPTVSLHCDKSVAVDEVVKVMNIAKENKYRLILATQAK
jgi:biopolymer transport protein ExbD